MKLRINNKINFLFSIPYLETKASAGTMQGPKGIQDLSVAVNTLPISSSTVKLPTILVGAFNARN
jgi:hypothetical protein